MTTDELVFAAARLRDRGVAAPDMKALLVAEARGEDVTDQRAAAEEEIAYANAGLLAREVIAESIGVSDAELALWMRNGWFSLALWANGAEGFTDACPETVRSAYQAQVVP